MENILIDKEIEKTLKRVLKKKNISFNEYINDLIKKDLTSKIKLENGYYFDKYLNKLFDSLDSEIRFSKKEFMIFKYLFENKSDFVSSEDIIKNCWVSEKNPSIFTLRNMIKGIRDKTYYGIIKSKSNIGYKID